MEQQPVYPRWRGEHVLLNAITRCAVGLSPLARGTRIAFAAPTEQRRFIPAGAGNTMTLENGHSSASVYPRWRGEHSSDITGDSSRIGLSPLARGTHGIYGTVIDEGRFIPAGAGNTAGIKKGEEKMTVYPRWRGEHLTASKRVARRDGLSPLARGTH